MFSLVYGKDVRLLIHLELNALAIAIGIEYEEGTTPLQTHFYQLMQLEEKRAHAMLNIQRKKEAVKKYFDQSATIKDFHKGQFVLLWNKAKEKPSLHSNFDALWIGPYQIEKVCGFNSYLLKGMDGKLLKLSCKWETFETFLLLIILLVLNDQCIIDHSTLPLFILIICK
jgi:hypothetical protein